MSRAVKSRQQDKQSKQIAEILGVLLADVHQLYIKSLAYHWNVEDKRFTQLHSLFQEQYTALAGHLDEIAEQIRIVGHKAPGALKEFAKLVRLKDTQDAASGDRMIKILAEDYETLVDCLKSDIATVELLSDPGTVDFLTDLYRQYGKTAWFLRSHLNGK